MSIWKKEINLDLINKSAEKSLVSLIGIKITEVGDNFIKGTMPVDEKTHQPFGVLHGGASVVLTETLGSIAGNLAVNEGVFCVGLEVNANHISKVSSGYVTGVAKPLHLGNATQVWEIKVVSDKNRLVCVSRLTLAIIQHSKQASA